MQAFVLYITRKSKKVRYNLQNSVLTTLIGCLSGVIFDSSQFAAFNSVSEILTRPIAAVESPVTLWHLHERPIKKNVQMRENSWQNWPFSNYRKVRFTPVAPVGLPLNKVLLI